MNGKLDNMLSSSLNLLLENAIIYMDEQLNLLSIKEGLPGMHKDLCSHYYSACMTTFTSCRSYSKWNYFTS